MAEIDAPQPVAVNQRICSKGHTMLQRIRLVLLCLVLAHTSLASAPQLVGPTASSGYFFTLKVSTSTVWIGVYTLTGIEHYPTRAEVVVRVQDGQGRPVDGVPVAFALEPTWAQSAMLSPPQTVTHGGVARSTFSAPQSSGLVRITARVDNTTARTALVVETYEERLEMD